jgi:coproporphyrinogen III oxidase
MVAFHNFYTPLLALSLISTSVHAFATPANSVLSATDARVNHRHLPRVGGRSTSSLLAATSTDSDYENNNSPEELFYEFTQFLINHQTSMIAEIEEIDASGNHFSRDAWGAFDDTNTTATAVPTKSGGITRVLQGGNVVEKGACSLTVIREGILTADRAATIQGRQEGQSSTSSNGDEEVLVVKEGDVYSAAALSVVLHTRNPFVPVRVWCMYVFFMKFICIHISCISFLLLINQ